jgi:prepilin-type N-terminal cleavage/methylation domain-containing protein
MLRTRAGFTLPEVIVALTLTAVLGAAVTGLFVSQSRFYETQEKTGFARGVSRGAINMMMSELRMVDRDSAMVSTPTRTSITVRVPYVMGAVCTSSATAVTFSRMPADTFATAAATLAGYAYREANGINRHVAASSVTPRTSTICSGLTPRVKVFPADSGGGVFEVPAPNPAVAIAPGTPLFLYQVVTYEFRASDEVPGRIGLWRSVRGSGVDEEIVAPFDTTAGFRFFVDDGRFVGTVRIDAEDAPPTVLSRITGLEITLDAFSERPRADGTFQRVPLTTSVFFRNRR